MIAPCFPDLFSFLGLGASCLVSTHIIARTVKFCIAIHIFIPPPVVVGIDIFADRSCDGWGISGPLGTGSLMPAYGAITADKNLYICRRVHLKIETENTVLS
jgi:hypothetical protein